MTREILCAGLIWFVIKLLESCCEKDIRDLCYRMRDVNKWGCGNSDIDKNIL